ncbi:MAG: AbrB/MazE/SpoVT family DNA-binding domain-containing protein [Thermoplasmata archaeon]|nr:AbrB/MazE/SpoVT family DNA-binding domain-containing protein [Thermoplasmata archaeon]
MAEIVSVDKAGRLVIPKSVRESLGIGEGTKFLLSESDHGRILLQKFNVEEIAKRLDREMKGKDVDAIVRKIRKEMNAKVKEKYPA